MFESITAGLLHSHGSLPLSQSCSAVNSSVVVLVASRDCASCTSREIFAHFHARCRNLREQAGRVGCVWRQHVRYIQPPLLFSVPSPGCVSARVFTLIQAKAPNSSEYFPAAALPLLLAGSLGRLPAKVHAATADGVWYLLQIIR